MFSNRAIDTILHVLTVAGKKKDFSCVSAAGVLLFMPFLPLSIVVLLMNFIFCVFLHHVYVSHFVT